MKNTLLKYPVMLLALAVLFACSPKGAPAQTEQPAETAEPTATEVPMAVRVNGEGIPLSEYESELRRYQDALAQRGEEDAAEDAASAVLEELISQTLLAQGAAQQGYTPTQDEIQAKYVELAGDAGGEDALRQWMAANHYDDSSFRRALGRDVAAAWMRNQIINSVPATAPQIRARQILLRNENQIISVERQLQTGTLFETLAYQVDPLTGGDLGWFPRGYLLQPDVENAAFALNPGEFSPIIQTNYGFHIVAVVDRDDAHPLSSDALLFMRRLALRDWLAERRAQSTIEQYIP